MARRIISSGEGDWIRRGRLWACPSCGKQYPRRGQGHSCVVVSLDDHFSDRPRARELFEAFVAAVEKEAGRRVRLSIARTRIGLITGMTFAAVMPRKDYLRAHILLARRSRSKRFIRVDEGPPLWVHVFEIRDESEIDGFLCRLIGESARIGARGMAERD